MGVPWRKHYVWTCVKKMDVEGEEIAQPEVVAQEPVEDWNEISALKDVMKRAICHDGLVRGIRECTKNLDKRRAQLCILADNCTEAAYRKLIQALCAEHAVPIMTVEDQMELGEWAGLCKIDAEGNPVKVVKASCVVIHNWGEDSPARQYLLANHLNN